MTEKELRRLSRAELLEMLISQSIELQNCREKLAEADFARLVDDPAAEQPSDAEKPEEKGAEESAQPDPDDTVSAKETAEQNAAPVEETEQNGDQPESV